MSTIEKDFPYDRANLSLANEANTATIAGICHALSSEFRLDVLRQIRIQPQTVLELAKKNYVAMSTMVFHINILLEAGLINIEYIQGQRGPVRKCYPRLNRLNIDLQGFAPHSVGKKLTYTMGVGMFIDASCYAPDCSFCTKERAYRAPWGTLYARERYEAGLFWTRSGYVIYAFPNDFSRKHCTEFTISLEICSETYYYDENYKSDITFWINGIELCTYTCPGDFGKRRGSLNPGWWPDSATQHGELKVIKVNEQGVFLDNELVNPRISIADLALDQGDRMLFKLGNKENAQYPGGFNLFGCGFGDYDQDIVLTATVQDDPE